MDNNGQRLDVYLAGLDELDLSRSAAAGLIEDGMVMVNGKACPKNHKVKTGDSVAVIIPPPQSTDLIPEPISIEIIYQDDDIAVINKPKGMVVHPANGHASGTLVNAVLFHLDNLSGINGELRPGIVHRLDKDTSGLLIIAKNDHAHRSLSDQFKERTCEKIYLAVVYGVVKQDEGRIDQPIARSLKDRKKMAVRQDGRKAITEFTVLKRFRDASLLECRLLTGRTHQIRVHMAYIGHPCIGDTQYGFAKQKYDCNGQALHAYKLSIDHPRTGERMSFEAPVPEYMLNLIERLQKQMDKN